MDFLNMYGQPRTAATRHISLVLLVFILFYSVRIGAIAQPRDARCQTDAGRAELLAAMPFATRYDIEQQAIGSGEDVKTFLENAILRECGMAEYPLAIRFTPTPDPSGHKFPVMKSAHGWGVRGHQVGTLNAELPPGWQVCKLHYRTSVSTTGNYVDASVRLTPGFWIDNDRTKGSRGYQVVVTAKGGRSGETVLDEAWIDAVEIAASAQEKERRGCYPASALATFVAGFTKENCQMDRSGMRWEDRCTHTHRAVGSKLSETRADMHKYILSKPEGDTGEESVTLRIHGGQTKDYTLRPGQRLPLLNISGTRSATVTVTTKALGADGKSIFSVHNAWDESRNYD